MSSQPNTTTAGADVTDKTEAGRIPEMGHIEEPYEGAGVGMVESLTETPEQARKHRDSLSKRHSAEHTASSGNVDAAAAATENVQASAATLPTVQ